MNLLNKVIESERLRLLPTSEEYAQDIFKEFNKDLAVYMLSKTS
jgi:hypothetical protein